MAGGYDDGYESTKCFWGTDPGSMVKWLCVFLGSVDGLSILDLGCGEGKNAAYLARRGAKVTAVDISFAALGNARDAWCPEEYEAVAWHCSDVRQFDFHQSSYDVVIMYGLLHCLATQEEIAHLVAKARLATRQGGHNILCSFNNRHQDLSGHPGFSPTLLPHSLYLNMYSGWNLLVATDEDLRESHTHNNIPHVHSLTRLVACKDRD